MRTRILIGALTLIIAVGVHADDRDDDDERPSPKLIRQTWGFPCLHCLPPSTAIAVDAPVGGSAVSAGSRP